jgi:hypothetical protein
MAESGTKKQIPLRLNPKLAAELNAWAEAEFRSLTGKIEYLLTECVRKHKGSDGGKTTDAPFPPPL